MPERELPGLWKLGSGNFTDYNLHVRQAYFAPDAQYMGGEQTLLQLHGIDDDGREVREMFSCGKDWISTDGGKTIEYSKGGNARIRDNSMYGHFLTALGKLGNDVLDQFIALGDPSRAEIYVGAVFHMDEQTFTYGGNISDQTHNMPVQFLGFDPTNTPAISAIQNQSQQNATPISVPSNIPTPQTAQPVSRINPTPPASVAERVAAAKAQAASAMPAPTPTAANSNGASSAIYATLTKLAAELDTFNSFVDAATDIPEVQESEELLTLVIDPTDAGYYATARAIQ